jgi:IS30 family transposase
MKKHHKITTPEQDQIAWWLAGWVAIREMAKQLGRSPYKVLGSQILLEAISKTDDMI